MTRPLSRLWQEHRRASFPGRLRTTEVRGVEMVMLDADIAGCVSSGLASGGVLDERRQRILAWRAEQLALVMPHLAGAEAVYFGRVAAMVAELGLRGTTRAGQG